MTTPPIVQILGERLIDAREAAVKLNLPIHWLTCAKQRRRRGVPHYRVGKLLRFKLSELVAWMNDPQAPENGAASLEGADAGLQ
jgi:hypothetical protein